MKCHVQFLLTQLCLLSTISLVLCDIIDPDDMRHYDPKTKTMRVNTNGLVDTLRCLECAECTQYVLNYCEKQSEILCQNVAKVRSSKEEKSRTTLLRVYLTRFINVFRQKSGLNKFKDQETVLSVRFSPSQAKILEDFVEFGDDSLLKDVDAVLSSQIKIYYPPLCAADYLSKIYEAKQFFAEKPSMFIILGILVMAAVFFYNVYYKHEIKLALLSLFATVFFSGYFWTYWKMHEELLADMKRVAYHRRISVCESHVEYYLWFFPYTVPEDEAKCREYYYAHYTSPLSKLTPTIVFYETMKIFWSGILREFGEIIILLFRELMDNSPWYIKWTVLPLVLIFTGLFLIICFAFLAGKRFKLSHPIFGAIELDRDPTPSEKLSIKETTNSFRLIKRIDGSISSHSCVNCGTEFVQCLTQTTVNTSIAQVSQSVDATDHGGSNAETSIQKKHQSINSEKMTSSGRFLSFGRNLVVGCQQNIKSGIQYLTGFTQNPAHCPQTTSRAESSSNDRQGIASDIGSVLDEENFFFVEDEDDAVSGEVYKVVTLENCSKDDSYQEANKENKKTDYALLPINSRSCGTKTLCRSQSENVVKCNKPLSPSFSSPNSPQTTGSRKKYFEEIKYVRSPNWRETRLIPTMVDNTMAGVENADVGDSPKKKFFIKSNEKLRRHFSFQASTELLKSSRNNREIPDRGSRDEPSTSFDSVRRKLSI